MIVTWQALAVDHDDGVGAMVMVLCQVCQRQLALASGARSFCFFFFFLSFVFFEQHSVFILFKGIKKGGG